MPLNMHHKLQSSLTVFHCLILNVRHLAISIAVVHYFSTAARHRGAITAILEPLWTCIKEPSDPTGVGASGKAPVYVQTLEQQYGRRRWGECNEQNVIVPQVMKQKAGGDGKIPTGSTVTIVFISKENSTTTSFRLEV